MKKPIFLIIAVLFTLTLYSQGYQFKIGDQFELTDRELSYLAYKDDKLYSYDSSENKIYIIDTNGIFIDSLSLNFKANGMDVYYDTLYVQSNVLVNKKQLFSRLIVKAEKLLNPLFGHRERTLITPVCYVLVTII